MDTVLYKLLSNDKQSRMFLADTAALLNETQTPLTGVALEIFEAALTFTCLLHGIFTNAKRVTLKLETFDPLAFMLFGVDSTGDVQGFATDELAQKSFGSLKDMVGDGGCIKIVYDNGADAVFTGIVEIIEDDIEDNLSRYFLQSEQTVSVFKYFSKKNEDGTQNSLGVMAQALPFADASLMANWRKRLDDENILTGDARTIEEIITDVFSDAYKAEEWRLRLQCTCSKESVLFMLMGLGTEELEWTISENNDIEVKCGKCAQRYCFGAEDIRSLIDDSGKEG